jgi:hypothetical protein
MNKGLEYIKKGHIERAIEWAIDTLENYSKITNPYIVSDTLKRFYAISAKYERLQKEISKQIIRQDEQDVRYSRIINTLIDEITKFPSWLDRHSFEIQSNFIEALTYTSHKDNADLAKKITDYAHFLCKYYNIELGSNYLLKKYNSHSDLRIGIVGNFSTGKASLINTIIKRNIIPVTILPLNLGIISMEWGSEEYVEIWRDSGEEKRYYEIDILSQIEADNSINFTKIVLKNEFIKGKKILSIDIGDRNRRMMAEKLILDCGILLHLQSSLRLETVRDLDIYNRYENLFGSNFYTVVTMIDLIRKEDEYDAIQKYYKALLRENVFFISTKAHISKKNEISKLIESIENNSLILREKKYPFFINALYELLKEISSRVQDMIETSNSKITPKIFDRKSQLIYSKYYINMLIDKFSEVKR